MRDEVGSQDRDGAGPPSDRPPSVVDDVVLENPRLLHVSLGPDVLVGRDAVVARQGRITFEAEAEAAGANAMLRRGAPVDGGRVLRASGSGELFLAEDGADVHLLALEDGVVTVAGPRLLAFADGMGFRTRTLAAPGSGATSAGVLDVDGTGWLAVTARGTPVRLATEEPTVVAAAAAVAWSSSLAVDLHVPSSAQRSVRTAGGLELVFRGEGFVLVQPSTESRVPHRDRS